MENKVITQYRAYLLRLWQVGEKEWRIMLEDPHTHQQFGFTDLEAVREYLQGTMETKETITPTHSEPRKDIP